MAAMNRWTQHTEDLATAFTGLLEQTPSGVAGVQDLQGTLACRDRVVGQLRALVGSVVGAPTVSRVVPLTVYDITQRPAHALHQALSGLPAAAAAEPRPGLADTAGLTDYEQLWRDAARACEGLQDFVDVLGELPGAESWLALRDLAEFSAALPEVDWMLSEAVLPGLKLGDPLALPYALLTSPAHDEVRLSSAEIQARVTTVTPARGLASAPPGILVDSELGELVGQCARQVRSRGADLSIAEVRAVTRLLQFGSSDAAAVLERAEQALPGAGQAADSLRLVAQHARGLRESPARSLGDEQQPVLRTSADLQRRLRMIAEIERRLGPGASEQNLRRLAGPAWTFAARVPALTRELEAAVRAGVQHGNLVVPATDAKLLSRGLDWVPASMAGPRDPAVMTAARRLSNAGEAVTPAVQASSAVINRGGERPSHDPVRTAAAAARASAGAAREQLRHVLREHQQTRAPLLTASLPAHPRLAPDARPLRR